MNRAEAIEKTSQYFQNLKLENERELSARKQRAEREIPALSALLSERAALPVKSLRLAMARPEEAAAIAEQMKDRGFELNAAIREALLGAGFAEDYLKPRYRCALCGDTGYLYGQLSAKPCQCFEKRVLAFINEEKAGTPTVNTFADFDESILPEEKTLGGYSQRELTLRIKQECEDYADRYPNTLYPGLILNGQVGVGKTFLLNCIYARLLERGVDALRIGGFELMERIRSRHFHQDEGAAAFDELITAPVLLIDDFGSEPVLKGISAEYLCLMINERMSAGRHCVITTNLTPPQFKEKYNDRLASRLMDSRYWDHLSLMGRDLRRA